MAEASSSPCIWCGQGKRTREHVLPNWLRSELERRVIGDVVKINGRHRLSGGNYAAREWNTDPFTLVVNAVCDRCNSGWSSRLESRTKPYLLKIITSGGACRLDRDAQATIAAWCFRTACTFDQVGDTAIPREYMDSFFRYRGRELAVGVHVHLGRRRRLQPAAASVGEDGGWGDPIAQLKWRSTTLEPWQLGICKTIIVLGDMVAQVLTFSHVNVEGTEALAADAVRIWPYTAALDWPMDFTALTVEETIADVVIQVGGRGQEAQSVLFTSRQRPDEQ